MHRQIVCLEDCRTLELKSGVRLKERTRLAVYLGSILPEDCPQMIQRLHLLLALDPNVKNATVNRPSDLGRAVSRWKPSIS